ncbi:MAG: hypothetical protein FWD71_10760 [Oscillospiraceae bacterium]|nr:hypothetical protein [Oscillospiraceae bacterium]
MKRFTQISAKLLIAIMLLTLFPNINFMQVSADQLPGTPPDSYPREIQNGGFELPVQLPGTGRNYNLIDGDTHPDTPSVLLYPNTALPNTLPPAVISGWCTTASDGVIEIWQSGFQPGQPNNPLVTFKSHDDIDGTGTTNNFFAEINGTQDAALYQDLSTDKGTIYQWSVWHRGRMSASTADVARLAISDPANLARLTNIAAIPSNVEQYDFQATNLAWIHHSGYYLADSDVTRFYLAAVSSASQTGGTGLNSTGNLVDDITWVPVASLNDNFITVDPDYTLPADAGDLVDVPPDPNEFKPFAFTYDKDYSADLSTGGKHKIIIDMYDNNPDNAGKVAGQLTLTIYVTSTVSGNVSGLDDNSGQIVTYTLDAGINSPVTDTTKTDKDGNYSIPGVPYDAIVTITPPAVNGYSVDKSGYTTDYIEENETGYDFVYTQTTHTVSGKVTGLPDNSGQTITYSLDGGATTQTVKTKADGSYSIDVPDGANIIITPPAVNGYSTPDGRSLNGVTKDMPNNDFEYIPVTTSPPSGAGTMPTPAVLGTEPPTDTDRGITPTAEPTTSVTESTEPAEPITETPAVSDIPDITNAPLSGDTSVTETPDNTVNIQPTESPVSAADVTPTVPAIPVMPESQEQNPIVTAPPVLVEQVPNSNEIIVTANDTKYRLIPKGDNSYEVYSDDGIYIGDFMGPLANFNLSDIDVSASDDTAKINPKTGDNIFDAWNLIILAILSLAITAAVKYKKRK